MRYLILTLAIATASVARADQVVDDFENGNPNQWFWSGSRGGPGEVNLAGGNPNGWFDSDENFYGWHPMLGSIPPPGSALATALASGSLRSLSLDFERLAIECIPNYDLPSAMAIEFADFHSDPGGSVIVAFNLNGPNVPDTGTPWQTVRFTIPSQSTDAVPDGWKILAPPELNYTWQDMMQNIDAISFMPLNPDDITYQSCWHAGADNIVITYGDSVFSDSFDPQG